MNVRLTPGRYVRLDLLANPHVQWHTAGAIEPGHLCAFQVGPDKMRRYGVGVPDEFSGFSAAAVLRRWQRIDWGDPTLPVDELVAVRSG